MKKINLLFFVLLFGLTTKAQTFELLDSNDVSIDGTTHYTYGTSASLYQTKFHIKNLTASIKPFALKATLEYTPYTNSDLSGSIDPIGFSCSSTIYTTQIINGGVGDDINANGIYSFRAHPVTWMWNDCLNDSAIWRVTVYDPNNISDSTSAKIIWKCTLPTSTRAFINKKEFSVYPNPSTSIVNIKVPNSNKQLGIKIYTLAGELMLQQHFVNKLDVSTLSKGIYLLKIDDYQPQKLIIQ